MSIRSFSPRPSPFCLSEKPAPTHEGDTFVNVRGSSFGSGPSSAGAAQRLEGSRFAEWQFCSLAASGSRERLLMMQLYRRCALIRLGAEPLCKNIALGCPREPLARGSCCVSGRVSSGPAVRFRSTQRRLPSGPWACNRAGSVGSTSTKRFAR
jgi:hypothetical protein